MHWFYMEGDEKKGPVDFSTMKELIATGVVAAGVPVWRSGFDAWMPAETVPGLLRGSSATSVAVPAVVTLPEAKYEGLGGWLILVGFGLAVTPLRILVLVLKDLLPAMTGETWAMLTTPGTEIYHPLWAPLLYFEVLGNLFFIGAALVLLVLFFKRKKIFPTLMIGFYLFNLVFIGVDAIVGEMIPFIAEQSDPESAKEVIRSVVGALIWVPYFLVSKRVKATFTR